MNIFRQIVNLFIKHTVEYNFHNSPEQMSLQLISGNSLYARPSHLTPFGPTFTGFEGVAFEVRIL